MREPPDARSGLPKAVEHRLTERQTAKGRIGASALLRAVNVLVRQHPRAAMHMFGAGIAQAARAGAWEVRQRLPGKRSVISKGQETGKTPRSGNAPLKDFDVDDKTLRKLERVFRDAERQERKR